MKKLFVILAAFVGLSLVSCTTEESATYIIHNTVDMDVEGHLSYIGDTPAKLIYDDFQAALIAFENKYEDTPNWNWTVTIKNGKYGSADSDAVAKYKEYESELMAIVEEYTNKFMSCADPDFSASLSYRFYLQRYGYSSDAVLGEYKYSIEY